MLATKILSLQSHICYTTSGPRETTSLPPHEDSDSDESPDYFHPPTKFLNQKALEMKRKSQKAKENFNKNLRRAVGLGLLSVIIGIGVFSPYNSAGDTLIKLIASQAPIAVGFTALGLILPVLGMVYCGVKAIKNKRDKVNFKRGSESITIDSQLYDLNKGKNPEKFEEESRKWRDRIEKAKSGSHFSREKF